MQLRSRRVLLALAALAAALPAAAVDVAYFEKRMTKTTLENGLTLLVYERPTAPVVSFFTYADVGSAQEVPGITGLAHMFEHMAFKGTSVVGSKDIEAEKKALAKLDEAYASYFEAKTRQHGYDTEEVERRRAAFEAAKKDAQQFVENNEMSEMIDRAGGSGMNAFTSADQTGYMMSLPANKIELWASLESGRFLDPVFREFYEERDVVKEERRMRTESNPTGRLIEQFLAAAFQAHPYGQPTVGHMSDLDAFSRQDAQAFFETYYGPANMTVAVVGDVDREKLVPLLTRYFGRIPARPAPPPVRTIEPPQTAEKAVTLVDPSQPVYVEGYHRPSAYDPDDAVYDAISDVLSNGRTSRLYRRMVRDEKIASTASAFNGFPGAKYPNMMVFFAIPTPGHTNDDVQKAIREEIERLKTEPITDAELKMVKTKAKASLVRSLRSNSGIASQLASYQALYGDWRELFRTVERIEKVTPDDIKRVAQATFVPQNRTVGRIVNEKAQAAEVTR